jgi:uncharacterized protein
VREPATISLLPHGKRLHLHDGPIDLIVEADGSKSAIVAAYQAASNRFVTILDELCAELVALRAAWHIDASLPKGVIAQRMARAVLPFSTDHFITPMAAVAGAVAEEILLAMKSAAEISRAYVNNGGDIAIHLDEEQSYRIGMVERPDRLSLFGKFRITQGMPVRGVATSGWRGRSFSLGIADAVTVLAETASMADAAATIIANAVHLPGHPAVGRVPANTLVPDSDLGSRSVTCDVGPLHCVEIAQALDSGERVARSCAARGLIFAVALHLQGQTRIVSNETLQNCMTGEVPGGSLLNA